MRRMTTYILTVHYYPTAIENNVTPVEVHGCIDSYNHSHYRSEKFIFCYPPTLDDFKQVISTQPWNEKLIPILDANQWPYLGIGKKSARTGLFIQDFGINKQVGYLEVSTAEIWQNEQYPTNIHVSYEICNRLTQGYKGQARKNVIKYIYDNELRIIGEVVKWSKNNGNVRPEEEQVVHEIRKIIKEWESYR